MRAMFMKGRTRRLATLVVVTLAAGAWAGCSLENPSAPALSGPSEFGTAVTLTASPAQLPRDGRAQSVVTVTVRDASNRAVAGQRLSVATDIGTVSESEVRTDSDGRATFTFTAPASGVIGNTAVIRVLPLGGGGDAAVPRTVTISFTGTTNATMPTALFDASTLTPVLRQNVVFDASATTDEGALCRDACTYSWDFGGEATASGRVVNYQFQSVRAYPVRLTVTDAQGASGSLTKTVTVSQGTAPTASFTFSPTVPGQFQAVNFTAEASRVGETGRTIASYQWRFGDGATATGATASHPYSVIGTYPVVLTVTDSAGIQGTSSQNVTIVNGVTALFNFTDQPGSLTVIFNAEESRGSDTGFGGRNTIAKYIWHFGTDETLTETTTPIISKTFPAAGTYTVTLTVQDSAGRRQTTFLAVVVLATN